MRYREVHCMYSECIQGNKNELVFVLLYLRNASVSWGSLCKRVQPTRNSKGYLPTCLLQYFCLVFVQLSAQNYTSCSWSSPFTWHVQTPPDWAWRPMWSELQKVRHLQGTIPSVSIKPQIVFSRSHVNHHHPSVADLSSRADPVFCLLPN